MAAWEGSEVGAGSVKVASLDFRNGLEMGSEDTGFRACFVGYWEELFFFSLSELYQFRIRMNPEIRVHQHIG